MEHPHRIRKNAQTLRKAMTREERHLWYDFLKTYPIPINRQFVFGSYIVDFYCYRAKLVIELDGSQHCTEKGLAYDQERTRFLEEMGLYVLRLSNRDVREHFPAVCENIDFAIRDRIR